MKLGQLPSSRMSEMGVHVPRAPSSLVLLWWRRKNKSKRGLGKECAAVYCKNKESKDSTVSFHQFPLAEPERLKQWVVNMKRGDSDDPGKLWSPSTRDRLCSKHFKDECFTRYCRKMNEECYQVLWKLESDAIPTEWPDRPTDKDCYFNAKISFFKASEERGKHSKVLKYSTSTQEPQLFQKFETMKSTKTASRIIGNKDNASFLFER